MSENINTAPLASNAHSDPQDDRRPTMIEVDRVSMVFNMANEQLNSLKEYAIALARRELMFKEFRALDNISFTVKKGDVFGILGTNGSGKSTMLKIIAGVLEPTEGSCAINGNIAPLIELGAGFDFELTARENIYLNGALLGYSRKFIDQNFDDIVEFAEIEQFLDMPMKNYSSGMVARIAFAIATVIVPEILIVDEVLSVGDFMFQQKCERRIMQLIKEHNVTVLIVSHNNDQIERLCNKAIWIEKGHTRMTGSAQDVCRAYRVLGGHVGSAEAEQHVFKMLNEKVEVPDKTTDVIAGESRYGTAAKLATECRFSTGGSVILASGELASPCMSATALAGLLDAPLLLARPDALPDATLQELNRLMPQRVIIIGEEDIISSAVAASVEKACASNPEVVRLPGRTAAQISWEIYSFGKEEGRWGDTAFITYDGCTADLISFSPYLFQKKCPVFFLVENGVVDEKIENVLSQGVFDRLYVLGGTAHVPDEFLARCRQGKTEPERIIGDGPYWANELINDKITSHMPSESTTEEKGVTIERLIVASVWSPFDALAAGAYAGKTHSAFLLEDPQDLDSVSHALSYIEKQKGAVRHLTFLGDSTRFSPLDRLMLAKAVVRAQQRSIPLR